MRRAVIAGAAAVVLVFAVPAVSQAAVIDNFSEGYGIEGIVVPCANGGAGEPVALTGRVHVVITTTFDASGGVHVIVHETLSDMSGVGLTTGTKYRATGTAPRFDEGGLVSVNQEMIWMTPQPEGRFEATFVNNFHIIGQGPGNNLVGQVMTHVTANANGVLTAQVENGHADCK
jgi:hypothetical protein